MKKGRICIIIGLLLLAAAFCLTAYNLTQSRRAGRVAAQTAHELETLLPQQPQAEQPLWQLHPELELPVAQLNGLGYVGLLELPSLSLELPVLAQWSYEALRQAPCRYQGTPYRSGFVIAGHNYAAHFGALQRLQTGDVVTFSDVDGYVFRYQVAAREVLPPTAVEEMTDSGWDLTLFTCTPGGQNRVTIRCLRAE